MFHRVPLSLFPIRFLCQPSVSIGACDHCRRCKRRLRSPRAPRARDHSGTTWISATHGGALSSPPSNKNARPVTHPNLLVLFTGRSGLYRRRRPRVLARRAAMLPWPTDSVGIVL
uniref:Secreted protein n=1 Tax=Plectus sambesii TaxID=2011161 RepID=A0A914XPL9_9BILA